MTNRAAASLAIAIRTALGVFAALTFVVIIIPVPVAIAEEPTGFNDLPWGTSRDEAKIFCTPSDIGIDTPAMMSCTSRSITLRGGWASVRLMFDDSTRLAGYVIRPEQPGLYHALQDAAIAKFGRPHSRAVLTYSRAVGGIVTGERLMWTWSSGTQAILE